MTFVSIAVREIWSWRCISKKQEAYEELNECLSERRIVLDQRAADLEAERIALVRESGSVVRPGLAGFLSDA
jgi:hypothetical protein